MTKQLTYAEQERRLKSGDYLYLPELHLWVNRRDPEEYAEYLRYAYKRVAAREADDQYWREHLRPLIEEDARMSGSPVGDYYERVLAARAQRRMRAESHDAWIADHAPTKQAVKGERKLAPFIFEEVKAADGGFSGYLAVYGNVDSMGDIIEPTAFTKTLKEMRERPYSKRALLPLLFNHDRAAPIGGFTELTPDATGLHFKAFIADTSIGRDVLANIKAGALSGMSIGYTVVKYDYDSRQIRHLRELALHEGSCVALPANKLARIDL